MAIITYDYVICDRPFFLSQRYSHLHRHRNIGCTCYHEQVSPFTALSGVRPFVGESITLPKAPSRTETPTRQRCPKTRASSSGSNRDKRDYGCLVKPAPDVADEESEPETRSVRGSEDICSTFSFLTS